MYEMYPEWGPARHRHDDHEPMSAPTRRPRYWERQLVGAGVGSPDSEDEQPDDN
jgi:hypothetical protein